jgi:purine-cytosine permease-like protein
MDYVYFALINIVMVVYTSWCWCLEGESRIYTMLDYLLHIVEYVVIPILDLICVDFYNKKNFTLKSSKSTQPPSQQS